MVEKALARSAKNAQKHGVARRVGGRAGVHNADEGVAALDAVVVERRAADLSCG